MIADDASAALTPAAPAARGPRAPRARARALRPPHSLLCALALLLALLLAAGPRPVRAWETEDQQIFDLQETLRSIEPAGDFYSVLEVPRSASVADINRAYRKKSMLYHPDKTSDPKLRKLHTLLTSMSSILKDDEMRKRYDGHLARGFPTWRGSGYYYDKYKPGLFTVVFFILFFVSVAQYIVGWIFYYREKQRIAEHVEALNELSYVQLKKHFQKRVLATGARGPSAPAAGPAADDDAKKAKAEGSPNLSKRALKSATPFELLLASGEIDRNEFTVRKPSLTDVAISRAAQIRMAQLPIVQTAGGRTRVAGSSSLVPARRQTEVPPISSAGSSAEGSESRHASMPPPQKHQVLFQLPHYAEPSVRSRSSTVSSSNLSQSARPAEYTFHPPAAAKYYLWDSTRIGPTLAFLPERIADMAIKIEDTAARAFMIHCTKVELHKPSSGTPPRGGVDLLDGSPDAARPTGYFLARVIRQPIEPASQSRPDEPSSPEREHQNRTESALSTSRTVLVVDRFDAGKQVLGYPTPNGALMPSVPAGDDVVIPVRFLANLALPNLSIKVVPIHPLRIVPTSLFHEISDWTDADAGSEAFGLMSIDQTRHLFLLSPDDPKSAELPLIGLWFKLHSSSPLDPRVHAACLRYLANKRLSKLDTGKQNMLVCMFPSNEELADATARAGSGLSALRGFGLIKPKMFECFYEASAESVALFVTEQTAAEGEVECSFSRVDLASTSQIGLCRAVERRLGIRLRQDSDYSDEVKRARSPTQPTSPPPVLGADQDAVSAGGNCTNEPTEHLGDPSGDQINADISVLPESQGSTTTALDAERPASESQQAKQDQQHAPTVSMQAIPSVPTPLPGGMDSQMLYMSMLQRQIEMLQAQIAVLTTQPPWAYYHAMPPQPGQPYPALASMPPQTLPGMSAGPFAPTPAFAQQPTAQAPPSQSSTAPHNRLGSSDPGSPAPQKVPSMSPVAPEQRQPAKPARVSTAMGTESPIVLRPPLNKAFSDPPRPVMLDAATNTSFMFDGGSACSSPERDASAAPSARLGDGEADSPRDELTTMMLESDLRRMHLTSISDALQPPADTGSNYAPVFDYANVSSSTSVPLHHPSSATMRRSSTHGSVRQGGLISRDGSRTSQAAALPDSGRRGRASETSHSKLWTDEPSADRDAGPLERPSACDIIAELVSDPEKSFVFEGSAATAPAAVPAFAPAPASAPVSVSAPAVASSPARVLGQARPPASPIKTTLRPLVHSPMRLPLRTQAGPAARSSRHDASKTPSELQRSHAGLSGHEDPDTSVAHEPYSRATFEYLQKYGLLEAESVADSAFDDSLLQPAF
ncbi:hypothetical protein HK105_205017 [Polyrhizophydium stewartii]|uniref:J domain-containing protein n=1 Tax=Polyrhizophydium stewartii TaxID=2732419 RepID=A0ABR4N788_9FUNG